MFVYIYHVISSSSVKITVDLASKSREIHSKKKYFDNEKRKQRREYFFCSTYTEINRIYMDYLFSCNQTKNGILMHYKYNSPCTRVQSWGGGTLIHNCFRSTQLHMLHMKTCFKNIEYFVKKLQNYNI